MICEKLFYLLSYIKTMPFAFNKQLWDAGRKIEDEALPKLNNYFKTNFKRNENNIFDILDFKDDEQKIILEVKGRFNRSDAYEDTIITASKVMAGQQAIDQGYRVFFLFVFLNCSKIMELKEDSSFKVKFTGTNCIKHYMIPVAELDDFDDEKEFLSINAAGTTLQAVAQQGEPEPEPEELETAD